MLEKKLKERTVYQDRLQSLGTKALDVVEILLTDTQTPIEARLNAAFRIFEALCVTNKVSKDSTASMSNL